MKVARRVLSVFVYPQDFVAKDSIAVIGVGAWGSALAQHLASNGQSVIAWCRNKQRAAEISTTRRYVHLKNPLPLHSGVTITDDIRQCLGADIFVIATPARFLSEVVTSLGALQGKCIVSAMKGMEPGLELTPLQFCARASTLSECRFSVISGPSFSSDVINGRPVSLVAAAGEEETAQRVAVLFMSSAMRVYTSTDPLGVELGGIVKNIIAIAAGVSDSLGYGPSARAGLITRGLAEMKRLALALGAKDKTLSGLSGLGDLIMTATDDQSRNRSVGLRLGRGELLPSILSTLGSEAEGPIAAPCVLNLGVRHGVEMPITHGVVRLLRAEIDAETLAKGLLSRPMKSEF